MVQAADRQDKRLARDERLGPAASFQGRVANDLRGRLGSGAMSQERLQNESDLDRRILLRAWAIAAVFFPVVALVNALSLLTDAERVGAGLDPRVPWILEFTSISV